MKVVLCQPPEPLEFCRSLAPSLIDFAARCGDDGAKGDGATPAELADSIKALGFELGARLRGG